MSTPSGSDREGAAASMRDLPGETALGHVDPGSVDHPVDGQQPIAEAAREAGFTPDVATARDGDPSSASSGATGGLASSDGDDLTLGDGSTGGDAAREALGVDPRETSGGEAPDHTQG